GILISTSLKKIPTSLCNLISGNCCPSKSIRQSAIGNRQSNVIVCSLSTSVFTTTRHESLPSADCRHSAYTGSSGSLNRVRFAPSKKHGCSYNKRFRRASSCTMFSGLFHARPVLPCTRIFSVASHSTPHVNPYPPLALVNAHSEFLSNDHARPFFASRSLSCVSL